ncbi:unnamed protein product [Bemisia tabaci]|uniref:C2H2-type domain-containing protein n=1 Tax=Bemisia tabaci TaxID=7038 RepID=A0A9P0A263_BEMTA|nr:unnamed protein product [Bemisia tabaci]
MSCYEQFSLSSEIDSFFRKINNLPNSLREYSLLLIKEYLTNPLPAPETATNDLTEDEVTEAEEDSLHTEIDLIDSEYDDECSILQIKESGAKNDPKVSSAGNDGSSSSTDEAETVEPEDHTVKLSGKNPQTHGGGKRIVEGNEGAQNLSQFEEVSSSHARAPEPINTATKKLFIHSKNIESNLVHTNKLVTKDGQRYHLVKRLRRSKDGKHYYENAAVPLGPSPQRSKIMVPKLKSRNNLSSMASAKLNSGNLKVKVKEPLNRLMFSPIKTKTIPPPKNSRTVLDVTEDNMIIFKNTSTKPIAFVPPPNVVVTKASESPNPRLHTPAKSTIFINGSKFVVPANLQVSSKIVDKNSEIEGSNSNPASPLVKKSTSSLPTDTRYRTILPKDLQPKVVQCKVLKEIQVSPNKWNKLPTTPKTPITVQLNSTIGSNVHMKNKASLPLRLQKAPLIKSNIGAINKRSLQLLKSGNNSQEKFHILRKKNFQFSTKQRSVITKQLTKYLKMDNEEKQGVEKASEDFVVIVDPSDVVNTEGCEEVVTPAKLKRKIKILRPSIPKVQFTKVKKPKMCEKCGKAFRTESLLKLHMKIHSPRFKCKKCGQAYVTSVEYLKHKLDHKKEEVHTCEFCRVQFNAFIRLKEHIRLHHPTQKLHKCQQCSYSAYTQRTLDSHIRYKHAVRRKEPQQIICPVCHKFFRQTSELRNHITTHLPERIFSCEACGKKFNQKTTLSSHLRNVHGERRYPCNVCPMILKTRDNQIRHMASHADCKLFPCPKCPYACNSQGNLVKHVRTQHNIQNFSLRRRDRVKQVCTEINPLTERGLEKGSHVATLYLNRLSKKLGKDLVSQLGAEQQRDENTTNTSTTNMENSDFANYGAQESDSEHSEQDHIETDAAVASLDKSQYDNDFCIIPETQRMLDDLIKESSGYTSESQYHGAHTANF